MSIDYAAELLAGSPRAAARLISWLEDEDDRAYEWMPKLHAHTGHAYIIGITGSPGAGKSTLTDKLARAIRKAGHTIGIIAVDPSSPFTGGALLGDRVRMSELSTDPDIYIRSMATRGFLGGTAKATGDVVKVLDAFGKDIIIIETVGVGQDEIDIIGIADTTVLVLVPGLGDAIQSMKAGIMEIADVFAINKADKPGADQLAGEVCARLDIDSQIKAKDWTPPVNRSIAVEDIGVDELWQAIQSHRKFLEESGKLQEKRRERTSQDTLRMIHNELFRIVREQLQQNGRLERAVEEIMNRKRDPYTLMHQIVSEWLSLFKIAEGDIMKVLKVDHIGIAVNSIEEVKKLYTDILGLDQQGSETVAEQKVTTAFFPVGETEVELLESTAPDGPIAKFLEAKGQGVQHIAFRVANIEEALAELKAKGVRLIDEKPRKGAGGAKIAFLHPKSTFGVLVELSER